MEAYLCSQIDVRCRFALPVAYFVSVGPNSSDVRVWMHLDSVLGSFRKESQRVHVL
jgi:hypothetical protein